MYKKYSLYKDREIILIIKISEILVLNRRKMNTAVIRKLGDAAYHRILVNCAKSHYITTQADTMW